MACDTCEYYSLDGDVYPCVNCKYTRPCGSAEYDARPDLSNVHLELKKSNDVVNHPSHYTQGGVECIDAMESAFGSAELAAYCKIAAFKYIWRCEHKNGAEDIRKAVWYLNKYLELITK